MVETIGICEKHQLPLDDAGECELCRLSDMPSKAPPARSAWWAVIIPLAVILVGALVTYLSVLSDDGPPSEPGVPPVTPVQAPAVEPEPEKPASERVPPRSTPPNPEDIPRPGDFEP